MEGKEQGCQGKERGREEGEDGREGEGRKVRTPPPSIPAYAPDDADRQREKGWQQEIDKHISLGATCSVSTESLTHSCRQAVLRDRNGLTLFATCAPSRRLQLYFFTEPILLCVQKCPMHTLGARGNYCFFLLQAHRVLKFFGRIFFRRIGL